MAPSTTFFNLSFVIQTNDSKQNKDVKWHNYANVKRQAALVRHANQRALNGKNSHRAIPQSLEKYAATDVSAKSSSNQDRGQQRKRKTGKPVQAGQTLCGNRPPLAEISLSIRTAFVQGLRYSAVHSAASQSISSPSLSSSSTNPSRTRGLESTTSIDTDTRAAQDETSLVQHTNTTPEQNIDPSVACQDGIWSWDSDKHLTVSDFALSVQYLSSKLPICKPVMGAGSAFDPFGLMHGDTQHNSSSSYEFRKSALRPSPWILLTTYSLQSWS